MVVTRSDGSRVSRCARSLAALLLLCAMLFPGLGQSAQPAREEDVKAAFLYNFAKFVEWPHDMVAQRGSIDVCVLGDDRLHEALERTLRGKVVREKPIGPRRLDSAEQSGNCHLLFVSSDHLHDMPVIVDLVERHHVLLVGEGEHFLDYGGAIAFRVENNRLRFDVDDDAAARAGLKLSSQLLKVARHVTRKDGGR